MSWRIRLLELIEVPRLECVAPDMEHSRRQKSNTLDLDRGRRHHALNVEVRESGRREDLNGGGGRTDN